MKTESEKLRVITVHKMKNAENIIYKNKTTLSCKVYFIFYVIQKKLRKKEIKKYSIL